MFSFHAHSKPDVLRRAKNSKQRRSISRRIEQLEVRQLLAVGAFAVPDPVPIPDFSGVVEFGEGSCTGTLLENGRHILTAAHCIIDNEIQGIDVSGATDGSYRLDFEGFTTEEISFDASASEIETEIENLFNVTEVTVELDPDDNGATQVFSVEFEGAHELTDVEQITVAEDNLVGASVAITTRDKGGIGNEAGSGPTIKFELLDSNGLPTSIEFETQASMITPHPNYTRITKANDIGLVELPTFGPFEAERHGLYTSSDEIGQDYVYAGYGKTGTGFTGEVAGTSGLKHMGRNTFSGDGDAISDANGDLELVSDFDSGHPLHDRLDDGGLCDPVLPFNPIPDWDLDCEESATASGDSGAGIFIDNMVAAVNSRTRKYDDIKNNFGDVDIFARVSSYTDWITSITDANYDLVVDMSKQNVVDDLADSLELRRSGVMLELFINNDIAWTDHHNNVNSMTIIGSSNREVLTVNYHGGNPFPAAGARFLDGEGSDDPDMVIATGPGNFTIDDDGLCRTLLFNCDPFVANQLTFGDGIDLEQAILNADDEGRRLDSELYTGQATLIGGTGEDDFYIGETPADVYAGSGDDRIFAGIANHVYEGEDDTDTLTIQGTGNADDIDLNLFGTSIEVLIIHSDGGEDTITVEAPTDVDIDIYSGAGDDYILLHQSLSPAFVDAGSGNDHVLGSHQSDGIVAGDGNDSVFGQGGDDIISGGQGNDLLDGQEDDDLILGDSGSDTLLGGLGEDTLLGGANADTLVGMEGSDDLFGQQGSDLLIGGVTPDHGKISDPSGDYLDGGDGRDEMFGDNTTGPEVIGGDDTMLGQDGGDTIRGQAGDDNVQGNAGGDWIYGFSGNDFLVGGSILCDSRPHSDPNPNQRQNHSGRNDDRKTCLDPEPRPHDPSASPFSPPFAEDGDDTILGESGNDTVFGDNFSVEFGSNTLGGGSDSLMGLTGDDTIFGQTSNDTILGGDHDDLMHGNDGGDIMNGEDGADTVDGAAGNDQVSGGPANDDVRGGTEHDHVSGNEGDDTLYGEAGDDRILGGEGNDSIEAGSGHDTVRAGDGDDQVRGGAGHDHLHGQRDNDIIFGNNGNDTLRGGAGMDELHGNRGADDVAGHAGPDLIVGGRGSDFLSGGPGNDAIIGDTDEPAGIQIAADVISGGRGNDVILGDHGTVSPIVAGASGGNDLVEAGLGHDEVYAQAGNDSVLGGRGDDLLLGGDGADTISAHRGDDTVLGERGDDEISGGVGHDVVRGGDGADLVNGERGNDILVGEGGNDSVIGGFGHDLLIGGRNDDVLKGVGGNDLLIADATAFDFDHKALQVILAEWTSSRAYGIRLRNISGQINPQFDDRLNGDFFLKKGSTVLNDGAVDILVGGGGRDWFLSHLPLDIVLDLVAGEISL